MPTQEIQNPSRLGDVIELLDLLLVVQSSVTNSVGDFQIPFSAVSTEISPSTERVLGNIARRDGFDPQTELSVRVLQIPLGRIDRRFALALASSTNPPKRTVQYVVDGSMLIARRVLLQPQFIGFRIVADEILFELSLQPETSMVTNSRTGERFRFPEESTPSSVSVAGDFSSWEPKRMALHSKSTRSWSLALPAKGMPPGFSQFKFQLEDYLWVEPPYYSSNVAPNPFGSQNLVLEVST